MTSKPPHITASALIRYCEAKAPERHRIIEEFRNNDFPPFKGWYGGETEGAVRRYLSSGGADDTALSDLENVLEKRPADTEFEEARVLRQLEALQATRETNLCALSRAGTISLIGDTLPPFFVQGVRVSIRPTNMISTIRPGFRAPFVGVTRPYFSSTDSLNDVSGALYGALLHWYAESQLGHLGQADPALCFVVDVFQRQVHRAPRAFKQRRGLIAFSCREIAERWNPTTISAVASVGK